jgi:hypothetical protein
MEVQVEINNRIVEWLSSMGYPVNGMPQALLRGMLLREAQQWQLSPSKLAAIINEEVKQPEYVGSETRYTARDVQPLRRTNMFAGSPG